MMRAFIILLAALLLLSSCTTTNYDSNYKLDTYYVIDAAGIEHRHYVEMLKGELAGTTDEWAKGDILLMLARLEGNSNYYHDACKSFSAFTPKAKEEEALLYETLGSINCGNKEQAYYNRAAALWRDIGVEWRASLLEALAKGEMPALEFDVSEIEPALNLSGSKAVIIGSSTAAIAPSARLATQTDRVLRDWLGVQLRQSPFRGNILKTFSERLTYSPEELREDIGWHEGGRLLDIMDAVAVEHIPAAGTIAAMHDGKWYAPDENGVFRFEVPLDKVSYPTARFLSAGIAMLPDTHGANMVVEQAIRNKAEVVIACCDHPGKAKAALYLSEHNITVLCFAGLEAYRLLGHNAKVLASPPFEAEEGRVTFGSRPLTIRRNEAVVVSKAAENGVYALWYYSAPYLYFSEVAKAFPLDMHVVAIDGFGQADRIYSEARSVNAGIVAARVFNKNDYDEAKEWLLESESNHIVLFHSMPYPYGRLLAGEFPGQASFGDVNPEPSA